MLKRKVKKVSGQLVITDVAMYYCTIAYRETRDVIKIHLLNYKVILFLYSCIQVGSLELNLAKGVLSSSIWRLPGLAPPLSPL